MKTLLAVAALLSLGAAQPHFQPASVPGSPVLQVKCLVGSGSAFRVSPQTVVSVNHVTSLGGCFIDGKPINVSYHIGDFSVLVADVADKWLTIDCGGFVKGREYRAEGYARGGPDIATVEIEGTGETQDGFAILTGEFTVIPGQSGGPVIDAQTGRVVGTVNRYDYAAGLSASVALKDTPLCRS